MDAGNRMAVGDDKIADFTADNYAALLLKHPQKDMGSLLDPINAESFQTLEYFVHKLSCLFPMVRVLALMALPHNS